MGGGTFHCFLEYTLELCSASTSLKGTAQVGTSLLPPQLAQNKSQFIWVLAYCKSQLLSVQSISIKKTPSAL